MSRLVLGIDPGLDEVAIATFDLDAWKGTQHTTDLVAAYVNPAQVLRTPPSEPLPSRLSRIHTWVAGLCIVQRPVLVAIEKAYAGRHDHVKGRERIRGAMNAESMQRFNAAWGVIMAAAALHCPRVEIVTVRLPKPERHKHLADWFERAGRRELLPNGPDAKDAVWVGMAVDWKLARAG